MGTRKCLSFPFKYKRSLNSNSGKMGLAGFLNKVAIPCPNNNKKRTEGPESLLHPEEAAYPPPDHHPDLGFSKYTPCEWKRLVLQIGKSYHALPSTCPPISHRSEDHHEGHGVPVNCMQATMRSLNSWPFLLSLPAPIFFLLFCCFINMFLAGYIDVPPAAKRIPSRKLMPIILTSDHIGCVEYGLK